MTATLTVPFPWFGEAVLGHYRADVMDDRLTLLHDVADAVAAAFTKVRDFGPSGNREGQYALDLVADAAALAVLRDAGVGVLSEESGFTPGTSSDVVVIDPIDGSTNASRGVPWFSTSLCLVDGEGPAVALVANQATGERYWAVRGGGAWRDEAAVRPSGCTDVSKAIIGLNGLPHRSAGAAQVRMFGAIALDLCLVAEGVFDGYVDCVLDSHGPWDYMAGVLILREAGGVIVDLRDRDLVAIEHDARRTPIAAATPELLATLLHARTDG